MALHKYQIGTPRRRNEGLRIGTVRFLPRGVQAKDYARLDYFDVWLPSLAPSAALMHSVRTLPPTAQRWKRFADRYEAEMRRNTDSRQAIRVLGMLSTRTAIAIGCYCADESRCHRSLLFPLLRLAAKGGF